MARRAALFVLTLAALPLGQAAWAQQYSTIPFPGPPGSGGPYGGLIADPSGTLYGTTIEGGPHSTGSVYSLSPAGIMTTLYVFGGYPDGLAPSTTLTRGPDGTLYGVTGTGGRGNGGVVFSLSPPAAGQTQWTYRNLHVFDSSTGCNNPVGVLYLAPSGQLYGVTANGSRHGSEFGIGVAYQLTPPAVGSTAWQFHVIHVFYGPHDGEYPQAGMIADATGALYGTTSGGGNQGSGVIYRLTPPASGQTAWTETILHQFSRKGGKSYAELIRDTSGNLYGSTGGAAFELSPPAPGLTQWAYTDLYDFTSTAGGFGGTAPLLADGQGGFYGTSSEGGVGICGYGTCGLVFHLTPPASGQTQWTETVMHDFGTFATDGTFPGGGGLLLQNGLLMDATEGGGPTNYGVIYTLQP